MLTIKDLTVSKELDRKAMAGVAGGMGIPPFALNIDSPFNAPKFAELMGTATSYTGEQINTTLQNDNDFNAVIGTGQVVNSGGNSNGTYQGAASFANNILTSMQ